MHIPEVKLCNSMGNGQQPSGPTLSDRWHKRMYRMGAVLVACCYTQANRLLNGRSAVWELEKVVWESAVWELEKVVWESAVWELEKVVCV